MYPASQISEYVLQKCIVNNRPITNLQLQGILFLIQRRYLLMNKPLFAEDFEAWEIGPVIPIVYNSLRGSGVSPISFRPLYKDANLTDSEMFMIDDLLKKYDTLPYCALHNIICKDNSAWDIVYKGGKGDKYVIPLQLIKIVATGE